MDFELLSVRWCDLWSSQELMRPYGAEMMPPPSSTDLEMQGCTQHQRCWACGTIVAVPLEEGGAPAPLFKVPEGQLARDLGCDQQAVPI